MREPKATVSKLEIEGVVFPPVAIPPGGSSNTLILAGAGVRGIEIGGNFIAFTAIGVYMEEGGVRSLSSKWKGKTVEELQESLHFYNDIISGSFEKLTRVTMLLPLTGQQYSGKVSENCVAYLKATDNYTDAEASAVVDFIEAFNGETFPPGSSIQFTHSPSGKLTIGFSKDGSVPEAGNAVIENKALSEALLDSIIGEHGVSPEAKRSLAFRIAELLGTEEIISPGQKPAVAEFAPISA